LMIIVLSFKLYLYIYKPLFQTFWIFFLSIFYWLENKILIINWNYLIMMGVVHDYMLILVFLLLLYEKIAVKRIQLSNHDGSLWLTFVVLLLYDVVHTRKEKIHFRMNVRDRTKKNHFLS
jgi:hypothetical protein